MDTFKNQHIFVFLQHEKYTHLLPQISIIMALGSGLNPRSYHFNQVQWG